MFGRLSYNYNLKNNGLELFIRKTDLKPVIGILLTWWLMNSPMLHKKLLLVLLILGMGYAKKKEYV